MIDVTVTIEGELEDELPDHVQTALYRIAQEAVGNSLRHASATCVDLLLEHSFDRVRLRVTDDGNGFSVRDVLAQGLVREYGPTATACAVCRSAPSCSAGGSR